MGITVEGAPCWGFAPLLSAQRSRWEMFILGKRSSIGIDPGSHVPIVVACATGIDHAVSPIVPILFGALELPWHFQGLLVAGDGWPYGLALACGGPLSGVDV